MKKLLNIILAFVFLFSPLGISPVFAAQTFTIGKLSESTNGKSIIISATATAGTKVHDAVAGTTDFDQVWLYAYNDSTANVVCTVEWGGVTDPDNLTVITIPYQSGRFLIADGRLINNGLDVGVFCGTTNVVTIDGYIVNIDNP